MPTPPILFKYQAFTPESLSNLANRQIWFSQPAKFNDPFDCGAIRVEQGLIPDSDYQRLYEVSRNWSDNPTGFDAQYMPLASKNTEFRKHIKRGLVTAVENQRHVALYENGVCCFSASNNEILMWSHYADGHKGFCMGFKTDSKPFSDALPVNYQPQIPAVNPVVICEKTEVVLKVMTLTKHVSWEYEQEWRLLHMKADTEWGYSANILESIYFGVSMPVSQQIVIGKLLDGTGTKFYQMERDPLKFTVCPKQISFKATP